MSDIIETTSNEQEKELAVLTAQRFLNIFRQIHIFSEKKKKQFDAELLGLSDEVIEALAPLPGASLLIKHIYELKGSASVPDFATVPAEDLNKNTPTQNPIANMSNIQVPLQVQTPVLDKSFAESFSNSITAAFEKIEKKHNTEMSQLLSVVLKTLQTISEKEQPAPAVQSGGINTSDLAGAIKEIMESQTQIFSVAMSEQTKAIAEIVSSKLKAQPEQHVVSPQKLENPVSENQIKKEVQSNNKMAPYTNDHVTNISPDTILPQENVVSDVQTSSENKRKKNKHKKKKNSLLTDNGDDIDIPELNSNILGSFLDTQNNVDDFSFDTNITDNNFENMADNSAPEISLPETENMSDENIAALDNIKNSLDGYQKESNISEQNTSEDWSWDKLDEESDSASSGVVENYEDETSDNTTQNDVAENSQPNFEDSFNTDTSNQNDTVINIDDINWNNEDTDYSPSEEQNSLLTESANGSSNEDSSDDWEWEYEEDPNNANNTDNNDWEWEYEEVPEGKTGDTQNGNDAEWEWEYEENNDNNEKKQ